MLELEHVYWFVTCASIVLLLERAIAIYSIDQSNINSILEHTGKTHSFQAQIRIASLLLLLLVIAVGIVEAGDYLGWGGSEFLLGLKQQMIWVGFFGCFAGIISANMDIKMKRRFSIELELIYSDIEFNTQEIAELNKKIKERKKSSHNIHAETEQSTIKFFDTSNELKREEEDLEKAEENLANNKILISGIKTKITKTKQSTANAESEIKKLGEEESQGKIELEAVEKIKQRMLKEMEPLQAVVKKNNELLAREAEQCNQLVAQCATFKEMDSKQKKKLKIHENHIKNLIKQCAKLKKTTEEKAELIANLPALEQEADEKKEELKKISQQQNVLLDYLHKAGIDIKALEEKIRFEGAVINKGRQERAEKSKNSNEERDLFE